jgi:hypothetical protein
MGEAMNASDGPHLDVSIRIAIIDRLLRDGSVLRTELRALCGKGRLREPSAYRRAYKEAQGDISQVNVASERFRSFLRVLDNNLGLVSRTAITVSVLDRAALIAYRDELASGR